MHKLAAPLPLEQAQNGPQERRMRERRAQQNSQVRRTGNETGEGGGKESARLDQAGGREEGAGDTTGYWTDGRGILVSDFGREEVETDWSKLLMLTNCCSRWQIRSSRPSPSSGLW